MRKLNMATVLSGNLLSKSIFFQYGDRDHGKMIFFNMATEKIVFSDCEN